MLQADRTSASACSTQQQTALFGKYGAKLKRTDTSKDAAKQQRQAFEACEWGAPSSQHCDRRMRSRRRASWCSTACGVCFTPCCVLCRTCQCGGADVWALRRCGGITCIGCSTVEQRAQTSPLCGICVGERQGYVGGKRHYTAQLLKHWCSDTLNKALQSKCGQASRASLSALCLS